MRKFVGSNPVRKKLKCFQNEQKVQNGLFFLRLTSLQALTFLQFFWIISIVYVALHKQYTKFQVNRFFRESHYCTNIGLQGRNCIIRACHIVYSCSFTICEIILKYC